VKSETLLFTALVPENRWRSQTIFSGNFKEKTCGIGTDYAN
jgi:hypothetical protein